VWSLVTYDPQVRRPARALGHLSLVGSWLACSCTFRVVCLLFLWQARVGFAYKILLAGSGSQKIFLTRLPDRYKALGASLGWRGRCTLSMVGPSARCARPVALRLTVWQSPRLWLVSRVP